MLGLRPILVQGRPLWLRRCCCCRPAGGFFSGEIKVRIPEGLLEKVWCGGYPLPAVEVMPSLPNPFTSTGPSTTSKGAQARRQAASEAGRPQEEEQRAGLWVSSS